MRDSRLQGVVINRYTSSSIGGLVNSDEAMAEFKHVVSEGDDNELSVLGPVFNVVSYNRNVSEVKRCIDLVHKVQRRWLEDMKGKN